MTTAAAGTLQGPAVESYLHHGRGLRSWLADGTPFGRGWTFTRMQALVRARGAHPAAIAALAVVRNGFAQPSEVAQRLEVEWAGDLAASPESANLVRLFRLNERAVREASAGTPDAGAGSSPPPARLQVFGAGATGIALAERASRSGIEVRLRDTDAQALARGLGLLRGTIEARRARGLLAAHEAEAQWARITAGTEPAGLALADLAIEAAGDDLDTKRRVFGELEVRVRPDAVLATTTSLLPLDELAAGLHHPERLVGLHVPDPVSQAPLVEVARGARTGPAALAVAGAFVLRLGRTPVAVADRPGFVVDRVLYPCLREALHLLEEGFAVGDVDRAMRDFGMARGPCAWMDEVGLDLVLRGLEALGRAWPDRIAPVPGLAAMVASGRSGRRSGAGFYLHRRGASRPDHWAGARLGTERRRRPATLEALGDRMVLALVNEAARALEDGVVADAGMLDLALVYGAGFPAVRGGPLRHADALGLGRVEGRLIALRAERGGRFQPAPLLSRLAAEGGSFTGPTG